MKDVGDTGTSTDRSNVVEHVFDLKLKQLLDEVKNGRIFGTVVAYTYTIEFQKRGLPHMHMLVIPAERDKFHTPNDVDRVVCVEIPDEKEDPLLHQIVLEKMIHIPCDGRNDFKCRKHGQSSKGFSKSLNEETKADIDGYPLYRRREIVEWR